MQCWNGFLVASSLALVAFDQAAPAQPASEERPADAEALFARFARMQGLEVSFRETKHIALLAAPLESRGKLYFMPPGHLCRVVEAPSPSKLTITPEELRLESRGDREVLDLRSNADLRAFITSLVRVFSGDQEGLERSYTIRYEHDAADASGWSLTLEPRGEPLSAMLRSLRLSGAGASVRAIELVEPGGDRTLTTVLAADPERRFDASEKAELFGIRDATSRSEGAAPGEKSP